MSGGARVLRGPWIADLAGGLRRHRAQRAGAGHLLDVPGQRDPDRDRRVDTARAAVPGLPHHLQRGQPLRIPGRARRWRHRRWRAPWRSCARRTRSCARATVVRLMKETASRAGGWTTELGWGILNAEAAVRRALELAQDTHPAEHQPARSPQPPCGPRLHPAVARAGPGPTGHQARRGGVLRRLRPARGPLQAPGDHRRATGTATAAGAASATRSTCAPGIGRATSRRRRAGRTSWCGCAAASSHAVHAWPPP